MKHNQEAVRLRTLLLLLAIVLPGCGGGGGSPSTPTSPTPPPATAPVAVSLVDGDDGPVAGVALRVDGVLRTPRTPGGNVFDLDRSLVGHALDAERDGFLVHQTFVPDRDRPIDLFEVPQGGSKAWMKNLLYDGVINRSGNLARLTRGVSLLRGQSVPAADWERARGVLEAAALRMGGVTGFPFQVADRPLPGTVPYTFEITPDLPTGGYFEWFGSADTIERGTVQFRTAARMADFSLVLHELTHGFGLSHSDRASDLMHPSAVAEAHSERERSVIDAVKRRPPGTAFEDNVRGALGARRLGATSGSSACGSR